MKTAPIGFVLLVVVTAGCQQRRSAPPKSKQAAAPAKVQVGVVPEAIVQRTVEFPATIESYEVARLMPKIAGYVEHVAVDIGDEVRAGQVLIELRAPELTQRVAQHDRRLQRIAAQEKVFRAELDAAHAQLKQVTAAAALKKSERDRMAKLVEQRAIGRQRLEEAEFARQSAEADISRYQNAVQVASARLEQGQSEGEVAQAALEEAEILAGYLTIAAPFDGVVTKRMVDHGNLVSPDDMGPLLVVAHVDRLRAVMHAASDVAGLLETGQPVQFVPDDAPHSFLEAPIARLAGSYDERTRMMRVEVDYDNRPGEAGGRRPLRAGSYGSARIVVQSTNAKVPAIPPDALLRRGDQALVAVVADGKCLLTPVTLGVEGDQLVEIQSGVAAGAQVVASGVGAVQDGQAIAQEQVEYAQW